MTVDDPTQSFTSTTTAAGGMVGTYMSVGIDALRDNSGNVYPPPSTDVEVTSTGGTGGNTSVTVDDPTQNYSNTTNASGGMVGTYMSVGIDALA